MLCDENTRDTRCNSKIYKLDPYFLMNWHNKNTFFQVCSHLKLCVCGAVQYWCWNFDMAAIMVEFHSYILLPTLTFIGRRSWCNIASGKEIGSFQRALNIQSTIKVLSKTALWKWWIIYRSKAQRFVSKTLLKIISRKEHVNFRISQASKQNRNTR